MEQVGQQAQTLELTKAWGEWKEVSLYLDRCQVDTPDALVSATWAHVARARRQIGKVVDFGAGDGRFAAHGMFEEYVGYEIDSVRCSGVKLAPHARLVNECAFSEEIDDADLCIGNPPFVRNQDLPRGWRLRAKEILSRRTGVTISGLANAWQYFFLLSLASSKATGLCALVVPYEWVSRPSARALREYIREQRWDVSVYRLVDATFDSVLTTSSITIIDKSSTNGTWSYFEETGQGDFKQLLSPSGSKNGVIPYLRRSEVTKGRPRAVRGLSPGTQEVLTLTEGERVRSGLHITRDVVPCVTTLRHLPPGTRELNEAVFAEYYRNAGQKCWLIRTDNAPSKRLAAYLGAIPEERYQTSTCLERTEWWKFSFPDTPDMFIAQSFKGKFPKSVLNNVEAKAVGGVCGIYDVRKSQADSILADLNGMDISNRVVAHSNGLRKVEVNQLNALFNGAFAEPTKGSRRSRAQ